MNNATLCYEMKYVGGMERPGTAAAVASRPTSSWGFSSRQQGDQVVPEAMKTEQQAAGGNPGLTRPHTAGAVGQRPGPGGGMYRQIQYILICKVNVSYQQRSFLLR